MLRLLHLEQVSMLMAHLKHERLHHVCLHVSASIILELLSKLFLRLLFFVLHIPKSSQYD